MGSVMHAGSGGSRRAWRFFRQRQAVARDVGVGGIQQGKVVGIAARHVLGQIVLERGDAIAETTSSRPPA